MKESPESTMQQAQFVLLLALKSNVDKPNGIVECFPVIVKLYQAANFPNESGNASGNHNSFKLDRSSSLSLEYK